MANEREIRKGVTNFGFVTNIRTFIQEVNDLLAESETPFRAFDFNALIDKITEEKTVIYKNKFGKNTTVENAVYALFKTAKKAANGKELIAYYDRARVEKGWTGIYFTTEKEFEKEVKDNLMFRLGALNFENWQDGLQFLEDLKTKCIPEKWNYKSHQSGIPHPILKSYIENTFEKLKVEDNGSKIIKSDDKKYIVFNTGLLDKFFHEIFIIVHVLEEGGETLYRNPYILNSLTDLTRIGFTMNGKRVVKQDDLPEPATFFTNINEVIFHPDIEIDRNYDKFTHIIEERRDRFPREDQERDSTELARKLDNSINYAIAIAKRNYKLVIPMYRPQEAKIQLLMPIYLSGSFTSSPDFALVLDLEDGIYTPETILPLDAAYQNARLITKPDELWLNPDDI
ncbi:DUF3825 domain-containing protein [Paludibacter sp.]|uniref:DUF3825 domain-containing protein n=1 Tax=Paludibacter sp. TaxID=1898105 RepID=UPI001352E5AF|nr:DUF3825 domain-containing protein [Paludibacter sp.]MTK52944.1 DUF3825 domain-containing protein [Paludibacter sp.]